MALHHLQEFDDDLAARADEDLALATLLGVVDGIERIVEDGGLNHDGGIGGREILKALKMRLEVSAWANVSLQEPFERKRVPFSARKSMEGFFSSCSCRVLGAAVSSSVMAR